MLGQQLRVAASHAEACTGRMRAWRIHAYGPTTELRLEEARVPPLRAPDEILVRVHASSVNPIDVAMIGGYGSKILNTLRTIESGEGIEFPLIAGRDFVGEVERAGVGAKLKRGERIWGVIPPHRQGAHSEYVVVKNSWAGKAPSTLSDISAGGALYTGLTAASAVRGAGYGQRRGGRVLLLGLGGVGHAALQLLVYRQVQVVVGCAGELCERAMSLGASRALDRHAPDYDKLLEECGPYDAIIDCAGLGGWEAGARRWSFSRYVTLSSPLLRDTDARGLPLGLAAAACQLAGQTARALAARGEGGAARGPGGAVPHVRWAYFMPNADDIEMLRRLSESGEYTVAVEQVYPWWEGLAAYERMARGSARGKLILDFKAPPPPVANN